ncbi:helix-hairpin-helix domain-containing protein [Desulfitobacterium sp. PCE1]|uniref:helix-hairpin-helix domain-containing protein n=1 Tax=Desulfitobacterium sp. PCE1 TaxID=146907 RepID=UPI000361B6AE|nr:helix-hairpin-helix domain-containing protein [Desulfitobacterium sp. PCE1]
MVSNSEDYGVILLERKIRYIWWGVLGLLIVAAAWKFILPHNSTVIVEKAGENREIVVYVSGAVEKPGLVHLPVNARLNDALKQVCPLPEANVDQINPAEKLKDGQKIIVPYKPVPQPVAPPVAVSQGQMAESNPNASDLSSSTATANSMQPGTNQSGNTQYVTQTSSNLININTADITELDKLPGIGPVLAERIIQYRTEHGPFLQPEDLKKVSGIGNKTYAKMADLVTVGP